MTSILSIWLVKCLKYNFNNPHSGMVTFKSDMAEDEVDRIFDAKYEYRELEKTDGSYIITVYGDAPFPDNIEGH